MNEVEALSYAVAVASAASYLLWLLPGACKCEKCSFHTNERNIARLRREEELEKQRAEDERIRHEAEHRGGAYLPGEPDRFDCHTATCPRNKDKRTT